MFYDNYVKLCAKKNKTPSAAAIEIGIGKSTVACWKSRRTNPTDATLHKMADYFGVPVSELTKDPDEKKPTPEGELTEQDIKLLLSKMSVDELWSVVAEAQNELKGRTSVD